MKPTTREHVIAATHFVLGPSNFLVLRLPENWDLKLGRSPMDIDYTIPWEGVRWAQEGRASALLVDPKARRAIELSVRTARGSIAPPKLLEPRVGTCRVGGHDGAYALGVANFGLFRTKRYAVLRVTFHCDETQRQVDLRLMHKGDAEMLRAFLPSLERVRCH